MLSSRKYHGGPSIDIYRGADYGRSSDSVSAAAYNPVVSKPAAVYYYLLHRESVMIKIETEEIVILGYRCTTVVQTSDDFAESMKAQGFEIVHASPEGIVELFKKFQHIITQ